MKRLVLAAAALAVAVARPETYKEKEHFQYSRTSSDDGSKSGFYGAQRGNMGGNFERAHNMDSLAQNQMSGVVRQVEGELGDASNTRTGSVYSAANSRGVYGSGHYDLSNLEGRNFQEGASYGEAQSHSSSYRQQSSSDSNNAYSHSQHSRQSGFDAAEHANQLQTSNLQTVNSDNRVNENDYNRNTGIYRKGYLSQSGYHGESVYGESSNTRSDNDYGSNVRGRMISTSPVRIIVRPGSRVDVPVAAQTYDSRNTVSLSDQHSLKSDAEVLSNTDYQTRYQITERPKHYESSYSYHKEWEKHDTSTSAPLNYPTKSFPVNSELYEDTQGHHTHNHYQASSLDSESVNNAAQSSNVYNGYNSAVSSQNRHQSNSQQRLSSGMQTNAAIGGDSDNSRNIITGDGDFRPKSYQSSYSYHKSWERQGDPYVIRPSSSNLLNQELLTENGHASHGTNYHLSHQNYANKNVLDCDCDENGHVRVARSVEQQNISNDQQSQNLEDLGQQTQNLEVFGQYSQNLEEFGQMSQNLDEFGQKSQNLEDFGQMSQSLDDFGQKSQNLEDFGQKSQNLADFGQTSQNLEGLGQQQENQWDKLTSVGQQTQNQWDKFTEPDHGQQTRDSKHTFENTPKDQVGQYTHNNGDHSKFSNDQIRNISDIETLRQNNNHPDSVNIEGTTLKSISGDLHIQTQPSSQTNSQQNLNQDLTPGIFVDKHQHNWQESNQREGISQHNPFSGNTEQYNMNILGYHPLYMGSNVNRYSQAQFPFIHNSVDAEGKPILVLNQYLTPSGAVHNEQHYQHNWQPSSQDINRRNYYSDNNQQNNMNLFVQHPTYFGSNSNTFSQTPLPFMPTSAMHPRNNNYDVSQPGSLSLNFWDKVNDIEKKMTNHKQINEAYSNKNYTLRSFNQNSEHDYLEKINVQQTIEHHQQGSHNTGYGPWQTSKSEDDLSNKSRTDEVTKDGKIIHTGRGDISYEDLPSDENVATTVNNNKHDNTTYEMETLSIVKNKNGNNSDLNIHETDKYLNKGDGYLIPMEISHIDSAHHVTQSNNNTLQVDRQNLDQHLQIVAEKEPENQSQPNVDKRVDNQNVSHEPKNQGVQNIEHIFDIVEKNENQNMEQQFEGFGQVPEKLNQQEIQHNIADFGQKNENQNVEQQFEGLGEIPENLNRQNMEHIVDFGQKNENSNTEQQFEGFGQIHENFNGHNGGHMAEFEQKNENQNIEQQFEGLGQVPENLNQQHGEHIVDFGQKNENQNMEQQFEGFGQVPETFNQQNVGHMAEFYQKNENQNMEQQFEGLGQVPENLHQQDGEQIVDFGQKNENQNTEQQFEGFDQVPENLNQQNVEHIVDFDQKNENQNTDQQFEGLNQVPENLNQQNVEHIVDFGQKNEYQNMEQQFESFGQVPESFKNQGHVAGYEQKNKTLSNKDMEQENENLSQSQVSWHSEDSGKQVQLPNEPKAYFENEKQSNNHFDKSTDTKDNVDVSASNNQLEMTPPEPVTEAPGFWKSVGSKFKNAKDSVASWFKS